MAPQSFLFTATLADPSKEALFDSLLPHLNVSYEYEGFMTTTCTPNLSPATNAALDPIPVLNDELGSRWVMSVADTAGRFSIHTGCSKAHSLSSSLAFVPPHVAVCGKTRVVLTPSGRLHTLCSRSVNGSFTPRTPLLSGYLALPSAGDEYPPTRAHGVNFSDIFQTSRHPRSRSL